MWLVVGAVLVWFFEYLRNRPSKRRLDEIESILAGETEEGPGHTGATLRAARTSSARRLGPNLGSAELREARLLAVQTPAVRGVRASSLATPTLGDVRPRGAGLDGTRRLGRSATAKRGHLPQDDRGHASREPGGIQRAEFVLGDLAGRFTGPRCPRPLGDPKTRSEIREYLFELLAPRRPRQRQLDSDS